MRTDPPHLSLQAAGLAIGLLHPYAGILEARILRTARGTISGYFSNPFLLARAVAPWNGQHSIYLTLNRLNPEVRARAHNHLASFVSVTTGAEDVIRRQWFAVDVDSIRPRGIAANEQELAAALALRDAMIEYARKEGRFPLPLRIMSGNGGWALWRVDLPNTNEISQVYKQALQALDQRFSDATAKIDPSVHAAAQLVKLPTTIAVKGDALPDRPHRRVEIQPPIPLHLTGDVQLVTLDQLQWLAGQFQVPVNRSYSLPSASAVPNLIDLFKAKDLYRRPLS